jgi:predicted nucleotidyltransferase
LHIPQIRKLCEQHKVDKLYAFGSVLTDRFSKESDVDLLYTFRNDVPLLEYADNYFNFKFSLEDVFNHPVDLVSEKQLSNPYFIKEIEATKQLIYG